MAPLPRRPLGSSGLEVSVMSLGSWRTFEHLDPEDGEAVMREARRSGITFLDDARYDDETGTAPLPTGWSEVVFGRLFRAAGWVRDEVVVANKLWWEHWPAQDAIAELTGSLERMGLDHVDLIYAMPPRPGLEVAAIVDQVSALIDAGLARHWGTGMWSAGDHHAALDRCDEVGAAPPVAAQMATSLTDHAGPTDPEMVRSFQRGPISLVASYVLAGGTLTGKYLAPGAEGRAVADTSPRMDAARRRAQAVVDIAKRWSVPPSHVAFAYAFNRAHLASVLFGARTPEQLRENVAAWDTWAALDDEQRGQVDALAARPSGAADG